MAVLWREALSVDRGIIDQDHRHLIDLINAIEQTVNSDHSVGELRHEVDQLLHYTELHFSREEEIMISQRYVKFDEHKTFHLRLVEQLTAVAKNACTAIEAHVPVSKAVEQSARKQLIELLRHWLLDHIIKEDMKMKPLLFA